MKSATPSLPGLVQSFFQEHLDQARGASPHTIRAYRDTLRLFFEYLARQRHCGVDRLRDLRFGYLVISQILSIL
jgi:site-specific recombinase XerD